RARWTKITEWLDEQPESSVLFLCFGSAGYFSVPQVEEIALGLEKSGHRFLWCLRATPEIHVKNLEEMLPKGFLERIGERGIVCGWAPQVEVLGHS
ncbi:hypothetical protein J0J30_23310, partial [Vibrio vulnificus]|nr:hypothetical protein [Vibrio vulnificus]